MLYQGCISLLFSEGSEVEAFFRYVGICSYEPYCFSSQSREFLILCDALVRDYV